MWREVEEEEEEEEERKYVAWWVKPMSCKSQQACFETLLVVFVTTSLPYFLCQRQFFNLLGFFAILA